MKRKFRFLLGVMLVWVVFPGLFSGCTRWKKTMTELEIKQAYLDSGTIKGTTIEDLTVNYVAEFDHASVVHMVNVKVEQWILTTVNDLGGDYVYIYPEPPYQLYVCYGGSLYTLREATAKGILNEQEWEAVADAVSQQFPKIHICKVEDYKPGYG